MCCSHNCLRICSFMSRFGRGHAVMVYHRHQVGMHNKREKRVHSCPWPRSSPIVCAVVIEKICPFSKPHSFLLFWTQLLSSLHRFATGVTPCNIVLLHTVICSHSLYDVGTVIRCYDMLQYSTGTTGLGGVREGGGGRFIMRSMQQQQGSLCNEQ